jgi:ribosomal protein S18 acetylase RimI-like enzyme
MKAQPKGKAVAWRKLPSDLKQTAETFLKAHEKYCVGAFARFLNMEPNRDNVWFVPGLDNEITALLVYSRHSLFPVLNKNMNIPGPRFLTRFFVKIPIHALQGLKEDAEILETLMEKQNYHAQEHVEYALMSMDTEPKAEALKAGPKNLLLRSPLPEDEDFLFDLQSAYEKEEVVPKNAQFNPAVCRLNLKHILSSEQVLVAELNNQVVGKINTNAESLSRYQVGGVYVRPDCRGLGIAAQMTAVFSKNLLSKGKGISLFVKKQNDAALRVYRKAGFSVLADYRVSYF